MLGVILFLRDLRFSLLWLRRLPSSAIWHPVVWFKCSEEKRFTS